MKRPSGAKTGISKHLVKNHFKSRIKKNTKLRITKLFLSNSNQSLQTKLRSQKCCKIDPMSMEDHPEPSLVLWSLIPLLRYPERHHLHWFANKAPQLDRITPYPDSLQQRKLDRRQRTMSKVVDVTSKHTAINYPCSQTLSDLFSLQNSAKRDHMSLKNLSNFVLAVSKTEN